MPEGARFLGLEIPYEAQQALRTLPTLDSLDAVLEHVAAVDDSWSSLVVCERAVLDPERAWKEMMALQTVDGGASKASLLYWIATRPAADAETKALLAKAHEAEAGGG